MTSYPALWVLGLEFLLNRKPCLVFSQITIRLDHVRLVPLALHCLFLPAILVTATRLEFFSAEGSFPADTRLVLASHNGS